MFEFHMRVVDRDLDGYYVTRWDRATPVAIQAENRKAAFEKCWQVMGDAPRGRTWTAKIDKVEEVT